MVNEKDYLLTNQEILGGLKAAIARGEELKDAMMTFYQAGYDKTEIEEAAKAYIEMLNPNSEKTSRPLSKKELKAKEKQEKKEKKEKAKEGKQKSKDAIHTTPHPSGAGAAGNKTNKKESKQKVSKYETPKDDQAKPPGGKAITIVLILVLLLLLGILTSVILFRTELVTFFNSLFA